ncbi:MAG: TIR domain-containing protein [Verrucomicrobia bacterium]|nr:TIR domain-containing protein [Verrucomicrobiota bacterium]
MSVERSELSVERFAPRGAVFLSYAREDTDAARRIADALRAFGVEVWFDQNELRGGDTWDTKIRTQIKTCALFVPLISQRTEERTEGYFRREWKLAVDRTQDMAGRKAFIVPVVIDETPESGADVPEEFMRYQWTRLANGEPTPEFVMQVKRLLEGPKKAAGVGRVSDPPSELSSREKAGHRPALPQTSRLPVLVGVIAALAIGAAVYFALRPTAKETAAAKPAQSPSALTPPPAAAKPPPDFASAKSLAVLPFTNMSEEKDSGFFSDGVHEDILTNLALIRELRVVSRTSVMQYRATTKTVRQIAQELGVAYILEGSVRRAGNKVRVSSQLIRAATDEHVWAKSYDKDLTDVFSIQSALATEIAGALQAALSPQEKQLLDRRPTENLAAYDAYVKGRQLRQGGTAPMQVGAELQFRQAVQLDPRFASAWAELGALHAFAYFSEFDQSAERLANAKAAIDTAVRLAPDAPEVIEKLGDYHYYGFRDYARAVEQYRRLAVLRPNDGVVYGSLGLIHRRQGRWRESLEDLRRAVQLEPRSLRYVRSLFSTAQALCLYDEATAAQRRMVELTDNDLAEQALQWMIPFLARGSTKEGRDGMAQLTPERQREPLAVHLRKIWARVTGDFAGFVALDRQLRYTEVFGEARGVQDANAAFVFAALGHDAEARTRAAEAVTDLKTRLEKQPTNASFWASLGAAEVLLGNRAEALRCAQKAMELVPESKDALAGPAYSLNHASCLAWLGEKDRALAELARLLRTPFGENVHGAKFGTAWFPLRGDPRFEALVNDPKNNAPLF